MHFMGLHTPKLDDKGRLFLPAKFRDQFTEGVVLTQGQDRCLVVWPPAVFEVEAERVAARPMTNRAARRYQRILFSGGDQSTPDKQGRITIPAHLREYAGLEREVVVAGVRDRLEIWNPQAWREFQFDAVDDFSELDEDDG